MSKFKKIVQEAEDLKKTEVDIIDKGLVNLTDVSGLREF